MLSQGQAQCQARNDGGRVEEEGNTTFVILNLIQNLHKLWQRQIPSWFLNSGGSSGKQDKEPLCTADAGQRGSVF